MSTDAQTKPSAKERNAQILLQRLTTINELAGNTTPKEIAEQLNISPGYLSMLASRHKISLAMEKKLKPATKRNKASRVDIAVLKEKAGNVPRKDLATLFEVSEAYLSQIASRHGINLRLADHLRETMDARCTKAKAIAQVSQEDLEAASKLLRSNGYTVLLPDPFKRSAPNA